MSDVHVNHCCKECGCKYGEDKEIHVGGKVIIPCPVVSGKKKQKNRCEYCEGDEHEKE